MAKRATGHKAREAIPTLASETAASCSPRDNAKKITLKQMEHDYGSMSQRLIDAYETLKRLALSLGAQQANIFSRAKAICEGIRTQRDGNRRRTSSDLSPAPLHRSQTVRVRGRTHSTAYGFFTCTKFS